MWINSDETYSVRKHMHTSLKQSHAECMLYDAHIIQKTYKFTKRHFVVAFSCFV